MQIPNQFRSSVSVTDYKLGQINLSTRLLLQGKPYQLSIFALRYQKPAQHPKQHN